MKDKVDLGQLSTIELEQYKRKRLSRVFNAIKAFFIFSILIAVIFLIYGNKNKNVQEESQDRYQVRREGIFNSHEEEANKRARL